MSPTVSFYENAQKYAQVICHILSDEMKLQYPQKFLLTEHGQFTWMLAIMDDMNLGGSMTKYIHESTLHRLSTALGGLPVLLSNHSGLRYAVLLSDKPTLPKSVDYPVDGIGLDVMPLGMGLSGAIHAHAKQIVNMVVVGAQDSGKSMFLRSLAHTARLHGSDLYLADPVEHTFNPDVWNQVSAHPVAHNTAQFLAMLERVSAELERRTVEFRKVADRGIPPEDIDAYNKLTGNKMPRVWVIADEANTFLASKAVQERLGDPSRQGRKYGVHIVLAGHDWHEYTVPKGLTSYFETRLCLRTSNNTTGQIVLDDAIRGKRTMTIRQPGRGIMRLRGIYQDVQLYNVASDREREWFDQVQPSDERMRRVAEQVEAAEIVPTVDPIKPEIAEMAERIRPLWSPRISKRGVGRLLGLTYEGGWTKKIDEVILYLAATTTTESLQNA